MKSILSLSLLFTYIFSAVIPQEDLRELAKVSILISHYQEHSVDNPDISLIAFWDLHYGNSIDKHEAAHSNSHQELPFKNHHHTHVTFIADNVALPHFSLPSEISFVGKKYLFPINNDIESNQRLSDIWQPPQIV